MNPNLLILKKGTFSFFSGRKTTRENFKISTNTTYIISLLFIWFLWIYYVWTLNINATAGYNIRNLELQKNNLNTEKQLTLVKIAEYESISNIIKWWDDSGIMEKVYKSDFIVVKDLKDYAFKN